MGIAIQHEQPELEKAKGEMLRREEDFKVHLASMEKDLLQTLLHFLDGYLYSF